jgi:hypothetical protein
MGFGDGVGVPTACPKSTPHMSSACVIRVGPSVEAQSMTCTVIASVRRLTESPLNDHMSSVIFVQLLG